MLHLASEAPINLQKKINELGIEFHAVHSPGFGVIGHFL
jgi:hypothetical protein